MMMAQLNGDDDDNNDDSASVVSLTTSNVSWVTGRIKYRKRSR